MSESNPICGVIFDLGGVIVRTEDWSYRQKWEHRLGLPERALHDLVFEGELGQRAMVGQATSKEVWLSIGKDFNLSPLELRELQNDFWRGDRLDLELVDMIRRLKRDYKTGLISNAWSDLAYDLGTRWQIKDAFDDILISAEVGIRKPDPRIYLLSLSRLGLTPDQAVFIDDQIENLAAAEDLEWKTIHFTHPHQTIKELQTLLSKGTPHMQE